MTDKDLTAAFHERMLGICDEAIAECGYNPGYFRAMVLDRGGLEAARELLRSKKLSEGLTRLYLEKRLDISMEATIVQDPWRGLFSAEELELAKKRLADLRYQLR